MKSDLYFDNDGEVWKFSFWFFDLKGEVKQYLVSANSKEEALNKALQDKAVYNLFIKQS